MSPSLDLTTAARQFIRLVEQVQDDQLQSNTPCESWDLEALIDHVLEAWIGLARAGRKLPPLDRHAKISTVATDINWKSQLQRQSLDLAAAWSTPQAWTGVAQAGRLRLPGKVLGVIALSELVLHGWDLAQATDQKFSTDQTTANTLIAFFERLDSAERGSNYQPVRSPSDPANSTDLLVSLSGRDPAWRLQTQPEPSA